MSSREPPQALPRYGGLYRYNLRPVVIVVSTLTAVWSLFAAGGNFRSISIDKQDAPKLAIFSIILGILYAVLAVFELFGASAAWTQRLPLIRTFTYFSIVNALIMIGTALISVVVHFAFKNDIINECTTLSENQDFLVYPFGFWGPVSHDFLNAEDAQQWCQNAWDRGSASEIISLIIQLLLAALFTTIAFRYYRQCLDPTSPTNFSRTPQANQGGFSSQYNPPYNASVPNLGYGYNMPYAGGPPPSQQFAPPPGPPPSKLPDYSGGNISHNAEKDENPFADFTEVTGNEAARREV